MIRHTVWLLLVLLVILRYTIIRPVYQNGDKVRITATVHSDPVKHLTSQYLKFAGLKSFLPLVPEISYGDKLVLEGTIKNGVLENSKIISVQENSSFLSAFRNKIIDFYQNNLPQPESGLLAGIILGAKGSIDTNFYDKAKLTGVAHIVVASGTNVAFVVSFLTSFLFVILPRKKAIPFVILGIISYLFMSGFDPPLIRAAIMSSCLFLGQEFGRLVSAWRIFFLSVLTMLIVNPFWIGDVGFVLSFVSTGSIMLFGKKMEMWLRKVPNLLKEDLAVTLSAQIGVAPILFVIFRQFNILSPVVNILVLWTVPLLMILGSVGGTVGLAVPILGKLILYLSYPMLWWFVRVVEAFSQ